MPRVSVAVCTRPDFDVATYIGKLGLQHAVDKWVGKGYELGDLVGADAVRTKVLADLSARDPIFFFGCGHGNEDVFTGQHLARIFWTCNCKELAARVVYLLSCKTSVRLGPDMVKDKRAVCSIGYNRIFGWIQAKIGDPLEDKYAKGFFEALLEILYRLTDGHTTGEAQAASIDVWNKWIDYWTKSDDPYASWVLNWMINDRDAQVLIGDPNATVTPPVDTWWWALAAALGVAPVAVVGGVIASEEARKLKIV